MTRPPVARCRITGCNWEQPAVDQVAALHALHRHIDGPDHNAEPAVVTQMPAVDWHTQALTAIRALAESGKPFVISEVINYGVPAAPNPRTDWASVQREAEAFGWIVQTGRLGRSVRPTTKGSPVAEWVGTFAAQRRTGAAS